MAPSTTTAANNNKISSSSHQKIFLNMHRKRSMLKSLFTKISGLQPGALSKKRLQHISFPVKLLRTRFFIEQLTILLKTVPVAIPNDICKVYHQKGFVICFLRSTYERFMEFLIETYNKGFSCSWIFSASWALSNALFSFSSSKLTFFNSWWIFKMFWIVLDGNVKTSSYLNEQKIL